MRFLLILFLSLLSISMAHAKIDITIDRNDVRVNETFQLTINVEDPKTLSAQQSMDFLPSELQVLSSQHFQKSTVIDKQFANQMGWTLTLISSQAGTYSIPKFRIGNEESEAITIRILPAISNLDELNPNSKVKMTARISDDEVYVQQQIIYTVRIYSSVPSRRHYLEPLNVNNAIVKKLGDASEFQMMNQGVRYNVKEEKYVIFPQQSGELAIPPMQFRTNIVDTQASFGSLSRYRPIELQSKPFTVQVKPKPDSAEIPWIPAKALELTAQWQEGVDSFEVGKPATLDFYIKGVALLPEQLPTIEFPEITGLKIYRDKPILQSRINANGVNSYHLEKLAIIPNQAGEVTIPALKIPYWDTTKDVQAFAELKPVTISIQDKINTIALPSITQQQPQAVSENSMPEAAQPSYWQYLTYGFAALWLATLLLFLFRKRNPTVVTQSLEKSPAQNKLSESIKLKALAQESDPKDFANALLQWYSHASQSSFTNLNQIINQCNHQKLAHELSKLQTALYANTANAGQPNDWDGLKIHSLLSSIDFKKVKADRKSHLPPLYPE